MIQALLALALLGTPAVVQVAPAAIADPRLRTLQYDPGRVVGLRVPLGYQTALILDPNEQVETVALGDSNAWEVTPTRRGDHVFIKPLSSGGTTNLTIVTDARVYVFELSVGSGPTIDAPFTVRFAYPETPPSAASVAAPPAVAPGRYRLGGSRSVRPVAVSDDGERTYVEWRDEQTLPAVFALDDRRREMLVDGQMRDGRYVIDAVYPTLVFRLDRLTARATRLEAGDAR